MRANKKSVSMSWIMVLILLFGSFFSTYTMIAEASEGTLSSLEQQSNAMQPGADAPDGDKDAPDGDKDAPDGDKDAPDGDKDALDGDKDALDGDKDALDGDIDAPDGDKDDHDQKKVVSEDKAGKGISVGSFGEPLGEGEEGNKTSILENLSIVVTNDGVEIYPGGPSAIDGTKDIRIQISFDVPVVGDGEREEDSVVRKGDYAKFPLSSAFSAPSGFPVPLQHDLVYDVGTVRFYIDEKGVTVARVDFDGDDIVFELGEGEAVSGVEGRFSADLSYNGDGKGDLWGTKEVTLLGKQFAVTVDTEEIAYTVTKEAATVMSEGAIEWTVTVEGTKTVSVGGTEITKNMDLDGYTFVDKLKNVGGYVADSFRVGDSTDPPDPREEYDSAHADQPLTYDFAAGMQSPQTVKFKTKIPDGKYFASDEQSIKNTAGLYKDDALQKEGAKTHSFTPPTWITKAGVVSGEYVEDAYNPNNRLITWTIEFNHAANALDGVKITDVLPAGLTWDSAKLSQETAPDEWEAVTSPTWDDAPANGEYAIGSIDYKGRLVIVTKVNNTGDMTTEIPFENEATLTWEGFPAETVGEDGITVGNGVEVGYTALTKSGKRVDGKDRTIEWTVKFDPQGQAIDNLKIYDLLVYGNEDTFKIETVTGIPADIDELAPRFGQKYIDETFAAVSGVAGTVNVIEIKQGDERVADLLEITLSSPAVASEFTFESLVLDPALFASNTSNNSVKVRNIATLYQRTAKMAEAEGVVDYNSSVLRKEMLNRAEVAKDYDKILPNNSTTTASAAFDYQQKSAIFRLSVNADGLDWAGLQNGQGVSLGSVTVTDTLPAGWVFDTFSNGADYLIYAANGKVNNVLQATAPVTPLGSVAGLTRSFETVGGRQTASFTFAELRQPYVILVKAKPTSDTLSGYLVSDTQPVTKTNSVLLKLPGWNGVSSSRDISVNIRALKKESTTVDLPDGAVKWSVEYNPYELVFGNELVDKLPDGVDLRLDANGKLLLAGNITAHEITINADGTYTDGETVQLIQEGGDRNVWYENADRLLHFCIPDENKAYRFTYVTDVTTLLEGPVSNQVKLLRGDEGDIRHAAEFAIMAQYGSATMQRTGWLQISKQNSVGQNLSGATFTLYAKDNDTIIRQSTSGADGICRIMAIPEGEYRLIETRAPTSDGYILDDTVHMVKVEKQPDDKIKTSVDGKTGENTHMLTVTNYLPEDAVGRLKILKTVTGTADVTDKAFDITVTLKNIPAGAEYAYTGSGVPGGVVIGGTATFSLADGQSITITGLPENATYGVVEKDYSSAGYSTGYSGATGTIVRDETQLAEVINAKNLPGELTISKRVEGVVVDTGKTFKFTVTFTTLVTPPAGGYDYVGHGVPDGKISSGGSIDLAHGQWITIKSLPEDTEYTVEEASVDGYVTQSAGAEGIIDTQGGHAAAFTNHAPGSLNIQKTVQGNAGDRTKRFDFNVTFPDLAQGTELSYTGVGVPDGVIVNGGIISLAHGESITISGLTVGTRYEVRENSYTGEGYRTVSTGETGVIIAGGEKIAAFTNTRNRSSGGGADPTGKLTIQKSVLGMKGDQLRSFTFVVTFDAMGVYSYSGSKSGMISSGQSVLLAHDEQIVISGLPVGVRYTVVEKEANRDGYTTTSSNTEGVIGQGGETARFVNTKGEQNPATGDGDTGARARAALLAFSCMLAALFGADIYFRRKNKKHTQE